MDIKNRIKNMFGVGAQQENNKIRRLKEENVRLRRELEESQTARQALAEALTHWLAFGSDITRSCVVDTVVPRIPELQELYAWFKERQVKNGENSSTTVPREGDETKLLEITMPLLAQASKLHGAMHNRCADLLHVEDFLRRISRAQVELALRIHTERGDDRKSLIEARDSATILALAIERYAAHISPGRWLRTPEDDEKSGQALVVTFAGAAMLLRDVIRHKGNETAEHIGFLPDLTKAALYRFLAERLIKETAA